MAYSVVLRPTGTITNFNWTVVAAADADDALRDDNLSTYLSGNTAIKDSETTFPAYAFPTGDRIEAVRIFALMDAPAVGNPDLYFVLKESGGTETSGNPITDGILNYQWVYSPWTPIKPTGGEWTQAIFNAIHIRFGSISANILTRIFSAGVEALVHTVPVVTIVNPSLNQKVSLTPTIQWAWQAGGDAQSQFRLKVFTKAVAEGGGFNPESSSPVYDASIGISSQTSYTLQDEPALTYNTQYYVYVKAASTFPSPTGPEIWYSAWKGVLFKTVSKPTVTVTTPTEGGNVNSTQPLFAWTYADTDGKAPAGNEIRVYAQPGGGWTGFDPNTTAEVPVYTYQSNVFTGSNRQMTGVQLDNGVTYRVYVRVTSSASPGVAVTSDWDSNTFTVVIVPPMTPSMTVTTDIPNARNLIFVSNHANELTENQSSIETSAAGWAVDSNVTLTRVTSQFSNGAASLQMVRGAASAAMSAKNATPWPTVAVGFQFTARAKFKTAVTARSCRVNIRWRDAGGATLSTVNGGNVTDGTGGWTEATCTATAPVNAVTAEIVVEVQGALAASETHFVDDIGFAPGTSATAPWSLGGRTGGFLMYLERSDDNGATWVPVRFAFGQPFDIALQAFSVYDYEAPMNTNVDYRVYVVTTEPGVSVGSSYATVLDIVLPTKVTWLKDPIDSSDNGHYRVQERWLSRSKDRQRAFFKPLGRSKPIAFRGLADGEQFSVSFYVDTQAEFNKLERLLDSDNGLLYQTPRKQWYVELTTNYVVLHALWDELHKKPITHIVQCTFMEVDRPEDV